MSSQVLVVSRDAMLLQTRQLILGAFFHTRGAGRVRDAEALISTSQFDLIILCYTLNEEESRRLIELADEQKKRPKILILTPAGTPLPEVAPGNAGMTESGPYYLLKKSAALLDVDIRATHNLIEA